MTQLYVEFAERRWYVSTRDAIDISIPLEFDGAQPTFFGAPPARSAPLEVDGFVGRVGLGGSCNCNVLTLTPHCNGTHTEGVGHVVTEDVSVTELAPMAPVPCRLTTVRPRALASSRDETSWPAEPDDALIDREALEPLIDAGELDGLVALVVRTTPNPIDKPTRDWSAAIAPYFTVAAVRELVTAGVEHLIVDLPSLDRANDAGRLAAHRAFWGLPDGSRRLADAKRAHCTVTELAFVPDAVPDGLYLLNLQVAPFASDASPSRPILLPMRA